MMLIQGGGTALHLAATYNSVDVFNVLLKNDPTLIKRTTKVSDHEKSTRLK